MSLSMDLSTNRVLSAARAILELMYAISATSYDVALLDHLPIVRMRMILSQKVF
jgi:hypothetical protein